MVGAPALVGTEIFFDTVSVGATINAVLAAARAEGKTVLHNTAAEPHVVDLCQFLNRAGAKIEGAGGDTITVTGVSTLRGVSYSVVPDMIEAGTYLLAGAITGGGVTVRGIDPTQLSSLLDTLDAMGADIDREESAVTVIAATRLSGGRVTTQPYPGFPTDLHPQMAALFCRARGESRVLENVWHHRFRYVGELLKMGASACLRDNIATFRGGPLCGASVFAPDLRAGAALLLAALSSEGESRIAGAELIERGYENYIEKFNRIGADIHLIDAQNAP